MIDLGQRIKSLQGKVNLKLGKKKALEEEWEAVGERSELRKADREEIRSAIKVLQVASETRRQELKDRVDSLVTRGLRAVFEDEDYEFSFKVNMARDQIGIIPMLKTWRNGEQVEVSIREGHGGGVADVVSFILRVVVLSLARPKVAPIMFLDEAFSHVSPEYLRGVAILLKELNRSAGVQFVMVTHKHSLLDAADTIYSAKQNDDHHTVFTLEHDLRDEVYHKAPGRDSVKRDRSTMFDHERLNDPDFGDPIISKSAPPGLHLKTKIYKETGKKIKRALKDRKKRLGLRKKQKRKKKKKVTKRVES